MDYNTQLYLRKKNKLNGQGEHCRDQHRLAYSLTLSPPQPQTPRGPMEFLSRSWSLNGDETTSPAFVTNNNWTSQTLTMTTNSMKITGSSSFKKTAGGIGKWFQNNRELSSCGSMKRKDKARAENAHMHAALCVAGLASALAAAASAENSISASGMGIDPELTRAVVSATELLASHCTEMAEQAGVDYERVASVVSSAMDIKSAGDLMTLTASAATALRAEAALRSRLPKEGKRNATILPYDKSLEDIQSVDAFLGKVEDLRPRFVGELLQHTRKGALRWRRVTVYINKKSQVMIKLKSKHVGGTLSKKDKCLVYGVSDLVSEWPSRNKEREEVECYFGMKTAQGFLEFKCKDKIQKKQWVEGVQSLLCQIGSAEPIVSKSF